MLGIWIRQRRVKGEDPERFAALPYLVRIPLVAESILMLALGVVLFVAPNSVASLWPWKLTALTSRAIGAWLLGTGVFALQAAAENDLLRIKAGLVSYSAFGLLQLIAVLRYPSNIDWTMPASWFYVVFLIIVLLTGLYSLSQRSRG